MGKGDKLPFIGGEVALFVAKFHIHRFYTVSGSQQGVIITAVGCTLLRLREDSRRGDEGSGTCQFQTPCSPLTGVAQSLILCCGRRNGSAKALIMRASPG